MTNCIPQTPELQESRGTRKACFQSPGQQPQTRLHQPGGSRQRPEGGAHGEPGSGVSRELKPGCRRTQTGSCCRPPVDAGVCAPHRFTPEQLYSVVADVDRYQQFLPWCTKSRVLQGRSGDFQAELEIGFPPLVERYTSEVTVVPNHKVRVGLWRAGLIQRAPE